MVGTGAFGAVAGNGQWLPVTWGERSG